MKKIKLIHIGNPDLTSHYIRQKMYSVSLGNKVNKWFSNKKDAVSYLVMVNEELNSKLHEMNYIYGYLFAEYRRIWFYLEGEYSNIEGQIRTQMHNIDSSFKLACERSHYTNGNYFTFNHLFTAIESMGKLCEIIRELLTERKYYADVHRMGMFRNMLKVARKSLDDIGKKYKPIGEQENELNPVSTILLNKNIKNLSENLQ